MEYIYDYLLLISDNKTEKGEDHTTLTYVYTLSHHEYGVYKLCYYCPTCSCTYASDFRVGLLPHDTIRARYGICIVRGRLPLAVFPSVFVWNTYTLYALEHTQKHNKQARDCDNAVIYNRSCIRFLSPP